MLGAAEIAALLTRHGSAARIEQLIGALVPSRTDKVAGLNKPFAHEKPQRCGHIVRLHRRTIRERIDCVWTRIRGIGMWIGFIMPHARIKIVVPLGVLCQSMEKTLEIVLAGRPAT